MSSNEVITESLCNTCVHRTFQSEQTVIHCKLLEEDFVKGKAECEDWEEDEQSEANQYECET